MRSIQRLLIAVGLGLSTTLLSPASLHWLQRGLLGWNLGVLGLLISFWWIIARSNAGETAARADIEDPGRSAVWLIAVAASLINLFGAIVALRLSGSLPGGHNLGWSLMSGLAVILSWVLTHTCFALRYAHQHYESDKPGFDFPGDEDPDDMDFAYFAFTIGMCFQTSDVSIQLSNIRRTVLGHCLISFLYNTIVVALTLNLILKYLS